MTADRPDSRLRETALALGAWLENRLEREWLGEIRRRRTENDPGE